MHKGNQESRDMVVYKDVGEEPRVCWRHLLEEDKKLFDEAQAVELSNIVAAAANA